MDKVSYGIEGAQTARLGPYVKQTLRERLIENKKTLEDALANITKALEFMDKNPGFEDFHDIIGKAGF